MQKQTKVRTLAALLWLGAITMLALIIVFSASMLDSPCHDAYGNWTRPTYSSKDCLFNDETFSVIEKALAVCVLIMGALAGLMVIAFLVHIAWRLWQWALEVCSYWIETKER